MFTFVLLLEHIKYVGSIGVKFFLHINMVYISDSLLTLIDLSEVNNHITM